MTKYDHNMSKMTKKDQINPDDQKWSTYPRWPKMIKKVQKWPKMIRMNYQGDQNMTKMINLTKMTKNDQLNQNDRKGSKMTNMIRMNYQNDQNMTKMIKLTQMTKNDQNCSKWLKMTKNDLFKICLILGIKIKNSIFDFGAKIQNYYQTG